MANRKGRDISMPVILMVFGGLLVLVVGSLRAWQLVRPAPTSEPTPEQAVNSQDVTRVSLDDAKAAFDKKTAVFVDVRDADSYNSHHIPGALSIPLNELSDRLGELDTKARIITYCT
jgi:3-mercaptopyruvate sulfurtransferase SseA